MTKPSVSVIIPAFNATRYIGDTLESLWAQDMQDFEIIIVDDKSTDGITPEFLDSVARREPRLTVLHNEENIGAGLSRNRGLEKATGEYITFLDSDDKLHPSALGRMLSLARENKLDILRASRCEFTDVKPPVAEVYGSPLRIFDDPATLRRIALCFIGQPQGEADRQLQFTGGVWGALYHRRLIFSEHVCFESERERGSEDFIFNFQATLKASRFGVIDDTLLHYRISPGSISRTIPADKLTHVSRYSSLMEQMLLTHGFSQEDARIAAMCYFLEQARGIMKYTLLGAAPLPEKLSWCRKQCRLPYVQAILREFPPSILKRNHRLHLWLMKHRAMFTLYLLTKLKK